MIPGLRKLVLAAVLTASIPGGRARACDHDRVAPPPAPAYVPVEGGWAPAPGEWRGDRDARWREHERRELREAYARLDEDRARFLARWGWHPGKVARYDRWYGERRAELDRRWSALDWYAAR